MKTRTQTFTKTVFYLTADDAPASVNAAQWLDRVKRFTGGVRGYGGEGFAGQWLKLTRSQWEAFQMHANAGAFPAGSVNSRA